MGRSWRCSANQNGSTTTSDGADRFRCPRELVLSWRAGNLSLEYRGPPLVECSPRDHLQPQVEPRPSCWHTDPTAPVQEGEGPNRGQHPPSDRAVAQDSRSRWGAAGFWPWEIWCKLGSPVPAVRLARARQARVRPTRAGRPRGAAGRLRPHRTTVSETAKRVHMICSRRARVQGRV